MEQIKSFFITRPSNLFQTGLILTLRIFKVFLVSCLIRVLPVDSDSCIISEVFLRKLAIQAFCPSVVLVLNCVQIFNCCIPALAKAQNSQVSNTVEHIIVVRRPIITLHNYISLLLFLLVLCILGVFLGCI